MGVVITCRGGSNPPEFKRLLITMGQQPPGLFPEFPFGVPVPPCQFEKSPCSKFELVQFVD